MILRSLGRLPGAVQPWSAHTPAGHRAATDGARPHSARHALAYWRLEDQIRQGLYPLELVTGAVLTVQTYSRTAWDSPLYRAMPFIQHVEWDSIVLWPPRPASSTKLREPLPLPGVRRSLCTCCENSATDFPWPIWISLTRAILLQATWTSAASASGSQKVISMARYSSMAVVRAMWACAR